ncbi:MAG: oxidoreductase [Actinomycetes bacterium]
MGLFRRRKTSGAAGRSGKVSGSDREYLETWAAGHRGVEAFVELRTSLNPPSVLLVAHDGEWTRRAVPDEKVAFDWARKVGIPCYDASLVGYPQRMRDWRPGG